MSVITWCARCLSSIASFLSSRSRLLSELQSAKEECRRQTKEIRRLRKRVEESSQKQDVLEIRERELSHENERLQNELALRDAEIETLVMLREREKQRIESDIAFYAASKSHVKSRSLNEEGSL